MKTFILTAAVALLTVATAQAVTVGWTTYPSSETQQAIAGLTSGVTVSLGSLANFSGSIENDVDAPFAVTAGNTYTVTNLAFAIWSEKQWSSKASKSIGVVVVQDGAIVAASTGTATQFGGNGGDGNHAYAGTDEKGFISFDFAGFEATTADSFTVYFVNTTDPSDITYEGLSGNLYNVAGVGLVDGAYRATVLPEPTALALLALGVAGVALRRRVA